MEINHLWNSSNVMLKTVGTKTIVNEQRLSEHYIPSAGEIQTMIESFLYKFSDRYPGPGPIPYIGPLDEALKHSLFDSITPRPLILYIHHDRSIATNIFCRYVLCENMLTDYLAEQFLVWAWDRTEELNYSALLSMLLKYTTRKVMTTIASFPIDVYPLLICLSVHQEQIDIVSVIQGNMSLDETLTNLLESRKKFDRRTELPHSNLSPTILNPNSNQFISTTLLKPLAERSPVIERITKNFENSYMQIIRIEQVENSTWLTQYLEEKKIIDNRLGHDQTEQFLFHGCPRSAANEIIQHGFDHTLIGMHGACYGYGFYFSSDHLISHHYAIPDPLNDNESTILVCQVLVGRTCSGISNMRTCPTGYDSTIGGSNIYVVYSNRQILPVYIITYKQTFDTYEGNFIIGRKKPFTARFCNIS